MTGRGEKGGGGGEVPLSCLAFAFSGGFRGGRALVSHSKAHRGLRLLRRRLGGPFLP